MRRFAFRRSIAVATGGLLALTLVPGAPSLSASAAGVETEPAAAENMQAVANLQYEQRHGQDTNFGTDLEIVTMRFGGAKHDVAFAGTYRNGLQIIDVTKPRKPRVLSVYDCAIAQGDVQIFERGQRTLAAYTADDISGDTDTDSACYRDLGITKKKYGTFIADVTDPRHPETVSFVPIARGSHNQSVHPSGKYLYNSNSDVIPVGVPQIEVVDIRNLAKPKQVATLQLIGGGESHDITFSEDGTRAYSAAISHTLVLDTTDPANPAIIGRIIDPTINIHHQSDPVTLVDPVLGERTFLVVTDELAGAAGNAACPGGGLHVYDITGELERAPVKVGFFDIPDVSTTGIESGTLRCTSHVLRMYPGKQLMTIAWYGRGVRVIDISGLAGVSVGGATPGMKEVGHLWFADSDTWSAKAHRIEEDGSMYIFANDINRGFDVVRFDAEEAGAATMSTGASRWLSPSAARRLLGTDGTPADAVTSCLLTALQ